MKPRRRQSGYMIEVAIVVAIVGVLVSSILPHLPPVGQKIAVVFGALIFIAGAYYMIVIPGWQPGASRLRWPWNLVVFILVALLIAFVAAAFVFAH
jgi:hypothetical protein